MNKLVFASIAGAISLLVSFSSHAAGLYQAVVSKAPSEDQFSSIEAALAAAPQDDSDYSIYIQAGEYRERLTITRPNVHFIGAGRDKTIIADNTSASTLKPDGKRFGTSGSRVMEIKAPDFSAQSLTIRNDFDYLTNDAKEKSDPTRVSSTQAVALLLGDESDRAEFYDVALEGYQDTFYSKGGRTYIANSTISGTVDFIFGGGNVVFDHCDVIALNRPGKEGAIGYYTAPSTMDDQAYGLTFINSRLLKEAGVPVGSYGLGRPWHPTRTFDDGRYADPNANGKTTYINTYMDDHIYGWDQMSGKDIKGEKIWFSPDKDARFSEYGSSGDGANIVANTEFGRTQLTKKELAKYTLERIFDGWQPHFQLDRTSKITGKVSAQDIQYPVDVTIKDQYGHMVQVKTDKKGNYKAELKDAISPLLVSAVEQGTDCTRNDVYRGYCLAALYQDHSLDALPTKLVINVNPLTDLALSNTAMDSGFIGPQQVVDNQDFPLVLSAVGAAHAQEQLHQVFDQAFETVGLPSNFDVITHSSKEQKKFANLVKWLWTSRNYHTKLGETSDTMLTDLYFQPLAIQDVNGEVESFDLAALIEHDKMVKKAKHRVFVIGDSTASIYAKAVYPRMGWAQVFQQQFASDDIQVIDAAQSGRSSRTYQNQGWFRFVKTLMQTDDYLLIQFGHNDEKCDGSAKGRGPFDEKNTCSYPNDVNGNVQYPSGQPDRSFQLALESYIDYAKQNSITPVLLTPITRVKNANGKTGFPVVHGHTNKQNSRNGFAFVGDYSQTIMDTAKTEKLSLLDVEAGTIAMVNKLGEVNWKDYWLAVDPTKFPYYEGKTGRLDKPDTTHLQEHGAQAVSAIVAQAIKQQTQLAELAQYLK